MSQQRLRRPGTPAEPTPRTTRSSRRRCGTPLSATSTPARGRTAGWRAGPTPARSSTTPSTRGCRTRTSRSSSSTSPGSAAVVAEASRSSRWARPGRLWRTSSATARVGSPTSIAPAGHLPGGEPGAVNVTANSNRATLKWRQFVKPSTPVPTGINPSPGNVAHGLQPGTQPADWDGSQSVGLFEGAQYADSGMYRLSSTAGCAATRRRTAPVCYTEMKSKHHLASGHSFTKVYTGDFNGDGKDDILIHNGNSILVVPLRRDPVRPRVQRGRARTGVVAVPAGTSSTSATSTATARTRSSCSTPRTG